MCDAFSLLTVGSLIYGANEQRRQGRQAQRQQEVRARILENDATNIRNKGTEEENAHRLKVARLVSKQKTQLAASGADVNSGSASLLLEDTVELGEADALRIRSNFLDQASSFDQRADFAREQGKIARDNANAGAISTLIGGAGTVAGKWYTNKTVDEFGFGQNEDPFSSSAFLT